MKERYNTELNGEAFSFSATIEDNALEVLREQADLTGAKLVCGTGACGACTILVDGAAKCACLLPAPHLEGARVQTVEFFQEGRLHPIQKAFLAHDGLQCGYCTPGFIVEGISFYREWREKHGNKRPNREQIAEALAGHLCRCAAYVGIYEAIASACGGDFEGPEMPEYSRVDALEKVTGTARYTTDIRLPGQLVGKIIRSPHPHARFARLDLEALRSKPGVKAAILLKEDNECHFEGEPIAAIAAETEMQAQAALKSLKIDWEVLPFVVDPKKAVLPDAPVVFDRKKGIPSAAEGFVFPGSLEGNLRETSISMTAAGRGKAKRERKRSSEDSPNSYSATYNTPTQYHSALEPHCALADWKEDGKLTVYASTQGVYFMAKHLADYYKLPEEDVTVIAHFVGGAFGAKQLFHSETRASIELSRAAGAPVAVVFSRAEEFTEAGHRPAVELNVFASAQPDGKKPAFTMEAYGSSGAAVGSSVAEIAGMCYTGIDKELQDFDVITHFQPGAPFRGPGGPAACFALEQSLDQLAEQLKLDPVGFRRQWEEHEGFVALFDWVESLPLWKSRKDPKNKTGRFRKGVGLAFGGWLHVFMNTAEVEVGASKHGFWVSNAVQDMGQGSKSVLAKAVAEVFHIPLNKVEVLAGKSTLPIGPTSAGSRTATSIFPAAREAAENLRTRIETMAPNTSQINSNTPPEEALSTWKAALESKPAMSETAKRGGNQGFSALGMLPLPQGMKLGKGRAYGAYVIETEVDTLTGKVRVTQVDGALRVGKIHHRPGADTQCYGGVIQGIGHALYEDSSLDPTTGKVLARGLEDYHLPGIGDVPEIRMHYLEEGFDFVKGKGIGLAEMCTIPIAGAIANAVYNAIGKRQFKAPIRPREVLASLRS